VKAIQIVAPRKLLLEKAKATGISSAQVRAQPVVPAVNQWNVGSLLKAIAPSPATPAVTQASIANAANTKPIVASQQPLVSAAAAPQTPVVRAVNPAPTIAPLVSTPAKIPSPAPKPPQQTAAPKKVAPPVQQQKPQGMPIPVEAKPTKTTSDGWVTVEFKKKKKVAVQAPVVRQEQPKVIAEV